SGIISPEGFLSSVLLWLVIIVAVVGVDVTVVVVIIVAVVVVVESSSVVKLSFSLRFRGSNIPFNTLRQSPDENFHHFLRIWHHSGTQGWAKEFHQDRASSVKVQVTNFTLQSSIQLLWENTDSVLSNQRLRPISSFRNLKFDRLDVHELFVVTVLLQEFYCLVLESWLVLQMLTSFWEAFYQHKDPTRIRLHSEDVPYLLGDLCLDILDDLFCLAILERRARAIYCLFSHLLSLKFSNLSMRFSEFSFQIVKILLYDHPTFSKTFYFVFYVLNAVEREFI
ncbi:hypothetical protein Tco_0108857, partial [Tanacetum coccineum]